MTAREMFEQLGYELQEKDDGCIDYWVIINDDNFDDWRHICFAIKERKWFADDNYESMYINIPTMKAIIKQCEELGWL